MAKERVNIKDISQGITVPVPISGDIDVFADKSKYYEQNKYVLFKNPLVDYEKSLFAPITGEQNIKYVFHDNMGTPLMYSDMGFTDDDIALSKNKFIRSKMRANYYNSDVPTSQDIMFQNNIEIQLLADQRGMNGELLPADSTPISFLFSNPINVFPYNAFNTGYYIYFYRSLYEFPYPLYSSYYFLNAKTGETKEFIAVEGLTEVNDIYQNRYIKTVLNRLGGMYFYQMDFTGRDITTDGDTITVNLYGID